MSELKQEDVTLTWPGSKLAYDAAKYHSTSGFVAVELYRRTKRDALALERRVEELERQIEAVKAICHTHSGPDYDQYELGFERCAQMVLGVMPVSPTTDKCGECDGTGAIMMGTLRCHVCTGTG